MSAKVDVLAVINSAVDALSETVATRGIAYKLGATHAAIAELIAADREMKAAQKAMFQPGSLAEGAHAIERFKVACERQDAALAAVGGEGQ